MSDGTEEETVEKSTGELLSETEDILGDVDAGDPQLGDTGGGQGASSDAAGNVDESLSDLDGTDTAREPATDAGTAGESTATSTGGDDRRFRKYFDPKSAGVSAVLVLAGALAGGAVPIPIVGDFTRLLGVGAATFLHGAASNDSRYAETFVASGIVGFLVALVTTNMFITLSGIGVPILAISTAVTMLVALLGHYFGRDLRAGLTQDIGAGGGGDDDVPGW